MRKFLALAAAIMVAGFISGCGGGESKPPPPTDVAVVPHDGSAVVTWTADPAVEYWIFVAPGTTITPDSCATSLACVISGGITPPHLVLGLTNGVTYSLVMAGRFGTHPIGATSAPVSFVPVLAGSNWVVGTPLATTLLGVGYTAVVAIADSNFIAAGAGGSLYSSPDSITWTTLNSTVTTNLNAVLAADARIVVPGDAGVIVSSTDGVTWVKAPTVTASNLYAVAFGGAAFVTVGANGTIIASGDGVTWTPQVSPTTNNLYGLTFGVNLYVAVGANGTVLTSPNGAEWTVRASQTTQDLKSVASETCPTPPVVGCTNLFVAVGANGALVTSPDGITWTAQPAIGANSLNGVVFGSQFIAVGNGGSIFTSLDGLTWVPAVSGTTNDLNAIAFSAGLSSIEIGVGYVAVGAGGVNVSSF